MSDVEEMPTNSISTRYELLTSHYGLLPTDVKVEEIIHLRFIKITKEQCKNKIDCAICLVDYAVKEAVNKLPCEVCMIKSFECNSNAKLFFKLKAVIVINLFYL